MFELSWEFQFPLTSQNSIWGCVNSSMTPFLVLLVSDFPLDSKVSSFFSSWSSFPFIVKYLEYLFTSTEFTFFYPSEYGCGLH